MISYYDIRHAKNAMRNLQGKVIRRRKLDIHYSIPKDNPSERDQNQGTLVVFNLDPSTTNEELKVIFGGFGEIKEVRETPNKKHHKFIEFYDIRDADRAMKNLNKTEIKGKKIKIEPSRPGGTRKNFFNQMVYEQPFSNQSLEEEPIQTHSMPFLSGIADSSSSSYDMTSIGFGTNSYPPVQQPLPRYIPGNISPNNSVLTLSPPPGSSSSSASSPPASFRNGHVISGRPRSRSVTDPTTIDESPLGKHDALSPIEKSSSSSSLPSVNMMWLPPSQESSPRSFSPGSSFTSAVDPRSKSSGFSPTAGYSFASQLSPLSDQLLSPTTRETKPPPEIETRRHRSHSLLGEEDKSKFLLVIDRVRCGEDQRTTLMIKNIPNKYSQKMLLSAVDERHKGAYDFFYLPIDFKVGPNSIYIHVSLF